jgi:tetratricopeptide (TPR) repeat protein
MHYILALSLAFLLLISCGTAPTTDKVIAKIGNSSLFVSDAEFLASIRPANYREKEPILQELQVLADNRRLAEAARRLFAGEQIAIQKDLAESENARLAQVYVYFYLQTNMGHTNKAIANFYNKNKDNYTDSVDFLPFIRVREKVAIDLFLQENPMLVSQISVSNREAVLDSCRRAIMESEIEKLKQLYKVELVKIEPPNAEEYYKANPQEFQTRTGYKLLSVSDTDSSALVKKIKKISSREDFAKIAQEMPVVKSGHAIMGIGMLPALEGEISNLGAKRITRILRAPDDTMHYYAFYIDSIIAPQLKSYDRAKGLVKAMLESKGDVYLDSSVVLVTMAGNPLITEKEVLALKEKIPPFRRAGFSREMAVKNLLEEILFARAAKEKGIDKSAEYMAWSRQIIDQAYIKLLNDSLVTKTLGVPEDSLKIAYEAQKNSLFADKSFEDAKLDVAIWLRLPDISYKREYALNAPTYSGNPPNWENIKVEAYNRIKFWEFRNLQANVVAHLQKGIPVSIIDTSWGLEFMASNFTGIAAQAKKQYENRNLQKARSLWETARIMFTESDSVQRAISYELANIYQELGSYSDAVNEYKIIANVWPSDPNTYKAYFMQGFVLSEYEKRDSLALIIFEEMLAKFPNSELSEDAKVLVENIKSGGKVLEDLIKKIEEQSENEP